MSAGRPALGMVPDEFGQVLRLHEFREAHPEVVIAAAGFGKWRALIPAQAGESVMVRDGLRDLLDDLDELTATQDGGLRASAAP